MATVAVGIHFQHVGAFARPAVLGRAFGGFGDREDIHAIDLLARNTEGFAALPEFSGCRAGDAGAHAVVVVFNHENDRELPQCGHVEAFEHLAGVHGAIADEGEADALVSVAHDIVFILTGKGKACAKWHLRRHDAVAAPEAL